MAELSFVPFSLKRRVSLPTRLSIFWTLIALCLDHVWAKLLGLTRFWHESKIHKRPVANFPNLIIGFQFSLSFRMWWIFMNSFKCSFTIFHYLFFLFIRFIQNSVRTFVFSNSERRHRLWINIKLGTCQSNHWSACVYCRYKIKSFDGSCFL